MKYFLSNRRFVRTLALIFALAGASMAMTSCSDDDDPAMEGNGISEKRWTDVVDADLAGASLSYEFKADGNWTAVSDADWCKVVTTSGYAGLSSLRLKVEPNNETMGRSAKVTIRVQGFVDAAEFTVRQGEGFIEKGDGRYRDVNEWMYGIMKSDYLWNEQIPSLQLDYSISYKPFLNSMLEGVAAFNDVNHDDGYWVNGQRQAFYSFIDSNAPESRTVGEKNTDSGLLLTASILGANDDDPCGLVVLWVTPGSPADKAGLKRGDFIDLVNNMAVTDKNYNELGMSVLNGNVTVRTNDVKFENGVATITPIQTVMIGKETYTDPAIYKSSVLTTSSGKKIGYLLYMGFHMDYDDALIDVFNQFKAQGVDELIVDLRYNNGGHVLSSTLLGTLVAGNNHKGEVYVRTTYNAARTAAGEVGEYFFGLPQNPEMQEGYDKIATALSSSLDINKVYVIASATTASASELFINGLRGVGVTVNLIGTTTNGKNVGMEGYRKRSNNYIFDFYPITFYCENAKGNKSYSNGFAPDLKYDDSSIYPGDFGTTEDSLCGLAISWANSGNKPNLSATSRANGGMTIRTLTLNPAMNAPLTRRMGGSIQLRNID